MTRNFAVYSSINVIIPPLYYLSAPLCFFNLFFCFVFFPNNSNHFSKTFVEKNKKLKHATEEIVLWSMFVNSVPISDVFSITF